MQKNNEMLREVIEILKRVREEKPVVDCITNRVTINDCANMLLAMGASPIMAEDEREMEEIVGIVQAVVLNMGIVINEPIEAAMKTAARAAKERGIPVIFDPVGAGASSLRNEQAAMILSEIRPDVIRGNLSEIKALSGAAIASRGVDASAEDAVTAENQRELGGLVRSLAETYSCVVCATGATDIISDGSAVVYVKNGHEMLCDVTGTGCMCSAMTGAACAAGGYFAGAVAAVVLMGLAGEYAQRYVQAEESGIGTFRVKLLDYIYTLNEDDFIRGGEIYSE